MPRQPIPQFRYPGATYDEGDGISNLILEQGRIQADAAARSGDMWANTIAGIGQSIGGAIQQRGEQKQLKKRDAAWVQYVQSGEWRQNPEQALAMSHRVWGPTEGPKQFEGLLAAGRLSTGDKPNPEQDTKDLGLMIGSMESMKPEARAVLYPQAYAIAKRRFPKIEISPEYNDDEWNKVIAPLGPSLRGDKPKELIKGNPGDVFLDPVTHKQVAAIPAAERPETRSLEVQLADAMTKGDTARAANIQRAIKAAADAGRGPREPKDPKLVQVETVDPATGKPVTQFITPTAGASFPKPTGAGKASTGQQKRALNFFNRAKEAAEIVDSLETGKKLSPTALKYVPDAANFLLSDENQAYRQAQRAFTEARLRKESGAAIKDEEYESDALKYFNQPGDSEATKAQKRAGRNAVLAGIAFESGDALKEFYGDEAEGLLSSLKASGGGVGGLQPMTSRDFSVKVGRTTYRFNSAAELDGFKKAGGIK